MVEEPALAKHLRIVERELGLGGLTKRAAATREDRGCREEGRSSCSSPLVRNPT
jgi:hypothetical protein